MSHRINETVNYHRGELDSLGWELTVSNALSDPQSPCRRILKEKLSFGQLLDRHILSPVGFNENCAVVEVGGGYGFLMRDLLEIHPGWRPVMIDISPCLLSRQKETLASFDARFVESDFFRIDNDLLRGFDLAILNENAGDFPTVCDVPKSIFEGEQEDPTLARVRGLFDTYSLERPKADLFNFNIGAVEAVEKLCGSGIRAVYLSEHSCEAADEKELAGLVGVKSSGMPERIHLKGHDEYTIKFSYLEKIAEHCGYRCRRGQFIDFIRPEITPEIRFIATSGSVKKDEHEVIRQFLEDLLKYEFLLLEKKGR